MSARNTTDADSTADDSQHGDDAGTDDCAHDQMTWDGRRFRCTDCPDQSGPVPGGTIRFD